MKGMTRSLSHREVRSKLTTILFALKKEAYLRDFSLEVFVKRSAYYFAEFNYIHPFREGNGRALREFYATAVSEKRIHCALESGGSRCVAPCDGSVCL